MPTALSATPHAEVAEEQQLNSDPKARVSVAALNEPHFGDLFVLSAATYTGTG